MINGKALQVRASMLFQDGLELCWTEKPTDAIWFFQQAATYQKQAVEALERQSGTDHSELYQRAAMMMLAAGDTSGCKLLVDTGKTGGSLDDVSTYLSSVLGETE